MRKAEIIIDLNEVYPSEVGVTFEEDILVSLDCDHCQRARRSVSLFLEGSGSGKENKCWPGSSDLRWGGYVEHPPYPGKLVDLEVKKTETGTRAIYQIEYQTSYFKDLKYPDAWKGYPTWARARFVLDCPVCEKAGKYCTQNNLGRPHPVKCSCGHQLYREVREMPLLRWQDPETGEWNQVEERFGAKEE
jgi:hypothetical protein